MAQGVTGFFRNTFPDINFYWYIKDAVYIVLTLVLARVIYWIVNIVLKKMLIKESGNYLLNERRAKTLYPLLRSIIFYTVSFFTIINILGLIGVKSTTLLAGVSAIGLAVGFGAQSLVKDIISGFFIIFEDQFAVGEFVNIDKFSGIVEEIGIRATKLRDWGGELHIIPNGTITSVTNNNRGKMRSTVDINLGYDQDVEKAMSLISEVGDQMKQEFSEKIVEGPTVQGIINLGEAFLVLRTVAYTLPMEQWTIEMELRKRIISSLTAAGIKIATLHKVYVEAKGG